MKREKQGDSKRGEAVTDFALESPILHKKINKRGSRVIILNETKMDIY